MAFLCFRRELGQGQDTAQLTVYQLPVFTYQLVQLTTIYDLYNEKVDHLIVLWTISKQSISLKYCTFFPARANYFVLTSLTPLHIFVFIW